ncbi:MAG: S8 family peptidase [Xanthobacteraceae bacterium]
MAENGPQGPGSAEPPNTATRKNVKFDPESLDRTLISLELLAAIRTSAEDDVLDVIIDLNLEYPKGREAAGRWIATWLKERFKQSTAATIGGRADGSQRESINTARSKFSQQYMFVALTPPSIRALASAVKPGPESGPTASGKQAAAPGADTAPGGAGKRRKKRKISPIYKIWLDHDLAPFTNVSIVTVKADAARAAFSANGQNIVWAVADSGIDDTHPHFLLHGNLSRLSPGLRHRDFTRAGDFSDADLEKTALQDEFGHGTHVAGIIAGEVKGGGANGSSASGDAAAAVDKPPRELTIKNVPAVAFRRERDEADNVSTTAVPLAKISGMAACCELLSLKVLDKNGQGKASNLIAAIEYIQHLNGNGRMLRVHGLNISVGYSYMPEWFACGQSPLCVEIDRLVRSGVCVVVAAGNDGYGFVSSINASGGAAAGLDVTISDPGNAERAITVGSTHRESPHTYGVSYFSSKGPTGDGRLKPDLLAPGEKILSCMSAQMSDKALQEAKLSKQKIDETVTEARKGVALYREDSGTSMAAPHVSGVIAAFLSNRREFIGRPEAVKDIFLSTATDLKRSLYFQGKGLVDLMRAIQSI